jgi:hypothetical protein
MRTLGRWPIRSTRKIVLKGSAEMKHVLASLTIGACLLAPSAGAVFAGQPGTSAGVNCGTASAPVTPGQRTGPCRHFANGWESGPGLCGVQARGANHSKCECRFSV